MKRITKMIGFMLAVVLIVSIFPVIRTEAAEKKYKLTLTGEYDLNDFTKADYQYTKTLKTVKLEQVEGKNQWNLTMYAGTAVKLPVSAAATVSSIDVTSKSDYLDVDYYESQGIIWIDAEDLGQKKTLTNKVITCKAYNKSKKCLSTLKIVVKILPHNAKLERKTPATADELYKLGYLKADYSDFAWKNVIAKYPEYLIYQASIFSKLYKCPENFDKEMQNVVYRATWEAFTQNMDEQEYYGWYVVTEEDCAQVQEILDSLNLNQFDTDWEKVLEVQKWVKRNIKYKVQSDPSVVGTLKRGNGDCDCYANLMNTACRLLDIPCYIVIDPNYMTVGHAWNIVLVDGLWCTMDLTVGVDFGIIKTGNFKAKPNMAAVDDLWKVYGGQILEEWEDLPNQIKNLIELEEFRKGHKIYLIEQYQEWLVKEYDSTVDESDTFKYWHTQKHILGKNEYKYSMWLQKEYNPQIHENNTPEYWYIHFAYPACGSCTFILEYFSDEFEIME